MNTQPKTTIAMPGNIRTITYPINYGQKPQTPVTTKTVVCVVKSRGWTVVMVRKAAEFN